MNNLFKVLFEFIKPVVVIFSSIGGLIAFLLGALADPQGLMNSIVCSVIDGIASLLPSTPDNLKVAYFVNSVGDSMPMVGRGIIREMFVTITAMVAIISVIKIYKLIPFKAT